MAADIKKDSIDKQSKHIAAQKNLLQRQQDSLMVAYKILSKQKQTIRDNHLRAVAKNIANKAYQFVSEEKKNFKKRSA